MIRPSEINICVDGDPVAKARPRIGMIHGRAMAFTPAHTKKYENHIRMAASQAMTGLIPFDEPLSVVMTALLPIPASWSQKKQKLALMGHIRPATRPDIDNYLKSALDGLNGIVFRDDCLVVQVKATKSYSDKPRLLIQISQMKPEEMGSLL